jgi:AraC family transcriptional regulator of adaptative response/methylated-DNA-[protein]-cysteine methyltransferase
METPLGTMIAGGTDKGITLFEFTDRELLGKEIESISRNLNADITEGDNNFFSVLRKELEEYFKGALKKFTVPVVMTGTEFQNSVWKTLLKIPYGTTWSYKEEAEKLGRPKSVRAVANANGQNRISIIIPCHRVIGSNGTLTGYGGGLWRKKWLLEHEAKHSSFMQ